MPEVRELRPEDDVAAGLLLGTGFVDDPAWRHVGPRWSATHRKLVSTVFHLGEVLVGRRRRGWMLGCYEDGELVGVTIAFPDGEAPRPLLYWLTRGAAFFLGGPLPLARVLLLDRKIDGAHPEEPHVHCWLLAAKPETRGVGAALMRAITERADGAGRDCYLEATAPQLASLYELLGFEVADEVEMSDGDSIRLMWRSAESRATASANGR
jgi:GNAT superfamily N-acetyltransferase